MARTPQDIIRDTSDLVSLPDIYIRVKSVIDDPDSAMSDLTAIVGFDPALAARLLTLANSAFFGFSSKIDTIDRAVNILGSRQIHDLVLATTVADAFASMTPRTLTMQEFWTNSVHCGLLAKSFASTCDLIDADHYFVEGLLFDIGHLILDQAEPDQCLAAAAEARNNNKPLHIAERELIGCDYAAVGAALMAGWNFPGSFAESVGCQNDPAAAHAFPLDAAILHGSVTLLRHAQEDFAAEELFAQLDPAAVDATGIEADMLEAVVDTAADELTRTCEMLFPDARECA